MRIHAFVSCDLVGMDAPLLKMLLQRGSVICAVSNWFPPFLIGQYIYMKRGVIIAIGVRAYKNSGLVLPSPFFYRLLLVVSGTEATVPDAVGIISICDSKRQENSLHESVPGVNRYIPSTVVDKLGKDVPLVVGASVI